jgi:LPS-assembly lipoprotein
MQRRLLLAGAFALAAPGCGFQLRQPPKFAFQSIHVSTGPRSALGNQLKRLLAQAGVQVLPDATGPNAAQVVLDLPLERREKVVVGLNASGQVTEFQLRTRINFRLRTPQGKELIPSTEVLQQRDISFSETFALAKEAEENLLYTSMESDVAMQLMRRLAAVKSI